MKTMFLIIIFVLINLLFFGCTAQSPDVLDVNDIREVAPIEKSENTNNVTKTPIVNDVKPILDKGEQFTLTKANPIKELSLKAGDIDIQYDVIAKKYMACGLYKKDKTVEQGIFLFSTAMTPGVSTTQGNIQHNIKTNDTFFIICTMIDDSDNVRFIIKQ